MVEDSKVSSLSERPSPMLFYPIRQRPSSGYVVVRTENDPGALLPALRTQLQAVSPDLPLSALGTLGSRLDGSLLMPTIAASLLGAFSFLAMILASVGIYAVVSFAVARRAQEMGIRIALGAQRPQLIRMAMREMLVTVTAGLGAGIGLALLAAPALAPVLYQVSAVDVASFAMGAIVLAVVAIVATYLPARRAANANPVEALRAR